MVVSNLRLGVFSLLVHDVQDHSTGRGAALRGGVDADGFLSSTCILLAVHINSAATGNIFIHITEQDMKASPLTLFTVVSHKLKAISPHNPVNV